MTYYTNPKSDENDFQAKQRWHRVPLADVQPITIIDLVDPASIDDLLARHLAAKHEAMLPFVQGMSAQLTQPPQQLLEFKPARQNLPHDG